jgi:adenosylcobinamide-GDP ribazoletransferase
VKPLFAALRFLTILPLPAGWCGEESALARSVAWFPVVGLLLGSTWAVCGFAMQRCFPAPVCAALLLILLPLLNGGLHLDGLADTADAFFSSRKPERMLEIMHDSRSGPMGVSALAMVLIAQYAALVSLPPKLLLGALLLAPVAGRCAIIISMTVLPYARPQGLVSIFAPRSKLFIAWGIAFLLACAWIALRFGGIIAAAAALLIVLIFCGICKRKINGFTGDTLGAVCTLAELAVLLSLCANNLPR